MALKLILPQCPSSLPLPPEPLPHLNFFFSATNIYRERKLPSQRFGKKKKRLPEFRESLCVDHQTEDRQRSTSPHIRTHSLGLFEQKSGVEKDGNTTAREEKEEASPQRNSSNGVLGRRGGEKALPDQTQTSQKRASAELTRGHFAVQRRPSQAPPHSNHRHIRKDVLINIARRGQRGRRLSTHGDIISRLARKQPANE